MVEEGPVDCIATSPEENDRDPLQMQVVQVVTDSEYHRDRRRHGGVEEEVVEEDLAEDIRASIEKKLDPRNLDPKLRPRLTLVLDAMSSVEHAMGAEKLFHDRHGQWLREQDLAFAAVWLVGPTMGLTHRLDDQAAGD